MFKFVQNCTYLIFLLIQALKILDGGGKYYNIGCEPPSTVFNKSNFCVIFINFAFSIYC